MEPQIRPTHPLLRCQPFLQYCRCSLPRHRRRSRRLPHCHPRQPCRPGRRFHRPRLMGRKRPRHRPLLRSFPRPMLHCLRPRHTRRHHRHRGRTGPRRRHRRSWHTMGEQAGASRTLRFKAANGGDDTSADSTNGSMGRTSTRGHGPRSRSPPGWSSVPAWRRSETFMRRPIPMRMVMTDEPP